MAICAHSLIILACLIIIVQAVSPIILKEMLYTSEVGHIYLLELRGSLKARNVRDERSSFHVERKFTRNFPYTVHKYAWLRLITPSQSCDSVDVAVASVP